MGFTTKNDHFGVFWGYHHFRKPPYIPCEKKTGEIPHFFVMEAKAEEAEAKRKKQKERPPQYSSHLDSGVCFGGVFFCTFTDSSHEKTDMLLEKKIDLQLLHTKRLIFYKNHQFRGGKNLEQAEGFFGQITI